MNDTANDAMSATMSGSQKAQWQEVCSVRLGEMLIGIPICHVLEILGKPATQPVPLAPFFIGGLVHYRGEVLTAVSLRRLLGMGPAPAPEDVLVFETAGGLFGLFVDAVGEVLRVSPADHEQNPPTLEGRSLSLFNGAWKLKDGLLITLDPERLDPMRLSAAA
jgi:purine-binding chemotaxis protein CheW